jgi:hypothetical protein
VAVLGASGDVSELPTQHLLSRAAVVNPDEVQARKAGISERSSTADAYGVTEDKPALIAKHRRGYVNYGDGIIVDMCTEDCNPWPCPVIVSAEGAQRSDSDAQRSGRG